MGTQCGPDLANWFGFDYELRHLTDLFEQIRSAGSDPACAAA